MNPRHPQPVLETDQAVQERYSAASKQKESALCCPVVYDDRYLEVIPAEIIERDYGCGDPSPYVRAGDTVLDLGSGTGKLCYIISQLVGESGRVIGVDVNSDMLALARSHQASVSDRIGFRNVDFKRGRIQDLGLDLDQLAEACKGSAMEDGDDVLKMLQRMDDIRRDRPMIASESIDCIVSNCVLNLVKSSDRQQLFEEMYRVLKPGGRAAVSDIVCNQDVPIAMQNDPALWSGCISGAWREDHFMEAFIRSGFQGAKLDQRQQSPWKTVNGIEFRSVTVLAFKPYGADNRADRQTVVYRGPFRAVIDDNGRAYPRGQGTLVDDATCRLFSDQAYSDAFYLVDRIEAACDGEKSPCDCAGEGDPDQLRSNPPTHQLTGTGNPTGRRGGSDCC